jgi:hypothetical protein
MAKAGNPTLQKPTCAQYDIDLLCDVLPLIKLARWAGHAGAVLSKIDGWRAHSPAFAQVINDHMPGTIWPATNNPGDEVEAVLCLAEMMLELHLSHEQG